MKSESRPRSLLGERLITQLEMTTSAVSSATGRFRSPSLCELFGTSFYTLFGAVRI